MRLLWAGFILVFCAVAGAQDKITDPPSKITFGEPSAVAGAGPNEKLLTFDSAVTTEYPENNKVYLRLIAPSPTLGERGSGGGGHTKIPIVLILHYWGASDLKIERALAAQLNQKGIGVAIMTLPYHLQRTPAGSRSGQLAVQANAARIQEMLSQAVFDVRRSLDWIEQQSGYDAHKIGIAGISLGSLVAELASAIDARVDLAAFMLGGADFAKVIWNSSKVVRQREAFRRDGYDESTLRSALVDVEPLTYLSQHQPRKSFVVGATYDSVMPREATDELISALHNKEKLWVDTGHYGGILIEHRLLATVAQFFSEEFAGQEFQAPKTLAAPTIRVGAQFTNNIQLGVGVDLVRPGRRNTPRISFFLTPREPEITIVREIDRVFGIGIAIGPRSSKPGIFWSTVL